MSASPSSNFKHAVFSDVDGTLVHYPDHLQNGSEVNDCDNADSNDLIYLPPSKTGTRGVISSSTLKLCHRLRHGNAPASTKNEGAEMDISSKQQRVHNGGVPFVLVSGMRTTTLFQRLPYLPRADAYVSESGGRIFYPCPVPKEGTADDSNMDGLVKGLTIEPVPYSGISSSDAVSFALVEDMHWRDEISQMNAAGSDGYDGSTTIEERSGELWECARSLLKEGYVLDSSGYATAFRVNRKHQNNDLALNFDDFLGRCANKEGIPAGLDCSTNLGCVDVYPAMSGKKKCTEYLVQKFLNGGEDAQQKISLKTHAYCLCDDDNDIEMALACRAAYLPSVTSESIRRLVNSQSGDGRLVVAEDVDKGIIETLATEAALEAILKELE